MLREAEFKTIIGQMAWEYYKLWLKIKYNNSNNNSPAFKTSNYFTAFNNFARFVQKTSMPFVDRCIATMVSRRIDPKNWTSPAAYRQHLNYIEHKLPFNDAVNLSFDTLFEIAEAGGVDIVDVFTVITPAELIQFLTQRLISPWVLLHSGKFTSFYQKQTSLNERVYLDALINADHWEVVFKNNPKNREKIKKYMEELGHLVKTTR